MERLMAFGRSLAASVAVVAVAAAGATGLEAALSGASLADLVPLGATLFATGMGAAVIGLTMGWWSRRLGLRGRLASFALIGIAMLGTNVLLAGALMFVSPHDLRLLVILFGFAIVTMLLPAHVATRAFRGRLGALERAAAQIAAGDLSARADAAGTDEVAAVARAFNLMAAEVEATTARRAHLEQARRDLFAAISHDLRTPLASLQAMAEAISDGVVDDRDSLRRYAASMAANVQRLSSLIDDLFELTRIESGDLRLQLERVQIEQIVAAAVDAARPQAERAGLAVTIEAAGSTPPVLVDPARIDRVLANILQNAIRHTPGEGSILLRTATDGPTVTVSVTDTGEGVAEEDLPAVFERFFRGDRARTAAKGRAGLGLSIAKGIVEAHGGQIRLDSVRGGGTTVVVALPTR